LNPLFSSSGGGQPLPYEKQEEPYPSPSRPAGSPDLIKAATGGRPYKACPPRAWRFITEKILLVCLGLHPTESYSLSVAAAIRVHEK